MTAPAGKGIPAGGSRDRDAAGRARSARPRDELGRPLPRSAGAAGAPLPGEPPSSPAQAAESGARLLAEGRPFHAHEVFEAAWKADPGPERELWRGLAQVAVGLTHARRGNARGAVTLLDRGAERLRGFTGPPRGVDAAVLDPCRVAAEAASLARRIERDGLAGLAEADFRLRLASGPCPG